MAPSRRPTDDTPPREANYISEWFGHRVYPVIAATKEALGDQKTQRCPFISDATGQTRQCVKAANSAGICTISSRSNGERQDWLVCPFRALGRPLLLSVAQRLFGLKGETVGIVAAPALGDAEIQTQVRTAVMSGEPVIVYLQSKLGGEISVSKTNRSPELSFDITMVELTKSGDRVAVGRYGILEIQTMDFHGTYKHVAQNLRDALRLHGDGFHGALAANPQWLSKEIEGPNIANVFKRTFYQMMLKFRIGAHDPCVGCVLAIPTSVWDSWQRHLGCPVLLPRPDGAFAMTGEHPPHPNWIAPAWIYVFDVEPSDAVTPNSIVIQKVIATDSEAMAYHALKVAPEAAVAAGGSVDRVLTTIYDRLRGLWPDLLPKGGPVELFTLIRSDGSPKRRRGKSGQPPST